MWTSEYAGRLIDLDLSSISDEAQYVPEDVPLTFSTPFLALDLLRATTPQRHLYRHDLESFYWSFVWIVLNQLQSKNTKSLLEAWRKGAKTVIAQAKETLFQHRMRRIVFAELSQKSPPISDCLEKLTELMARAYKELDEGRERISYEAFLNIFP